MHPSRVTSGAFTATAAGARAAVAGISELRDSSGQAESRTANAIRDRMGSASRGTRCFHVARRCRGSLMRSSQGQVLREHVAASQFPLPPAIAAR